MEYPYHWFSEEMVRLEREQFKKEMDSIRLINDAGLSNPGLIQRLAIKLGQALFHVGNRLYQSYTEPHQAYEVTSCKYAA